MSGQKKLSAEAIKNILDKVELLVRLHQSGMLGGEVMPEDANPGLVKGAEENYLYFTLPMALNYQRNSYRLWESAARTYEDKRTADVFSPFAVIDMSEEQLREKLSAYKLAVQPNKHPQIWMRLCKTLTQHFNGSVKRFFSARSFSILEIKKYMLENKKMFPYLSGAKIMNYWLYVMEQYTDAKFTDRIRITVAPDTHVLHASVKLGLIEADDLESPNIRGVVSDLWNDIFSGTDICPIDIHTPLWLWSRGGFSVAVE